MSNLLVPGESPRKADAEQFRMDGWLDTAPFEVLLGMRIEELGDGRAVLRMPFTVRLSQGGGVLHGGALTALADTAVALAVKTRLPDGTRFGTRELSMRFLAPVREGIVTAVAALERVEGRSFFAGAELLDEGGELVARFSAEFRVAREAGAGHGAAGRP
jgi:acyl-CoA thioesterase